MLAKPQWFKKRKYGGWGVHPKTWQGWIYIFVMILLLAALQALPFWDTAHRVIILFVWLVFFGIDVVDVMIRLEKDEMEQRMEAFAERNAAWAMMAVMVVGVVYQVIASGLNGEVHVDPFLFTALIGGVIVKSISYYSLERNGMK